MGKNLSSVEHGRYEIFMTAFKPKKRKEKLASIEGVDGSALPPCKTVLTQQIARANTAYSIWNNAFENNPFVFDPVKNRWLFQNDIYVPNWYDG